MFPLFLEAPQRLAEVCSAYTLPAAVLWLHYITANLQSQASFSYLEVFVLLEYIGVEELFHDSVLSLYGSFPHVKALV